MNLCQHFCIHFQVLKNDPKTAESKWKILQSSGQDQNGGNLAEGILLFFQALKV